MKQPTPSANPLRDLTELAVFAALLIAVQVGMAFLPNIELISLLIILMARHFKWKSLLSVGTFVLVEGLIYGFHLWWINYLYIWPLLVIITLLIKKDQPPFIWALIAGFFGLFFGTLCSIPYFITGGAGAGFGYIISGIPFDLIHCISNFILVLLLFKPLDHCLKKIL